MFDVTHFTREPATEAEYSKRAISELERFAQNTGLDWDREPEKLLSWLEGRRNGCAPATWRKYRAALCWFFHRRGIPGLVDSISSISTDGCSPDKLRTSSKKKKSVSDDELLALTLFLLAPTASEVSRQAYYFLAAGIITGLRPSEWATCEEVASPTPNDSSLSLRIRNAKHTNGRAHGPTRTLHFSGLDENERGVIRAHLANVAEAVASSDFADFQKRASAKIWYASKKLWPHKARRVALYSGRHQSQANCKKDGLPLDVIAALHGQATDRTPAEHYGRAQYGYAGRVRMAPEAAEVARVKKVAKTFTPPARNKEITKKKDR